MNDLPKVYEKLIAYEHARSGYIGCKKNDLLLASDINFFMNKMESDFYIKDSPWQRGYRAYEIPLVIRLIRDVRTHKCDYSDSLWSLNKGLSFIDIGTIYNNAILVKHMNELKSQLSELTSSEIIKRRTSINPIQLEKKLWTKLQQLLKNRGGHKAARTWLRVNKPEWVNRLREQPDVTTPFRIKTFQPLIHKIKKNQRL